MKAWKLRVYFIAREIFQYSLCTYLLLLMAEIIKPGLVSFFFNLNILLAVVLVSGLLMGAAHQQKLDEVLKRNTRKKIKVLDVVYLLSVSLGGCAIAYIKLIDFRTLSVIITVVTLFILLFLSYTLLFDFEE